MRNLLALAEARGLLSQADDVAAYGGPDRGGEPGPATPRPAPVASRAPPIGPHAAAKTPPARPWHPSSRGSRSSACPRSSRVGEAPSRGVAQSRARAGAAVPHDALPGPPNK